MILNVLSHGHVMTTQEITRSVKAKLPLTSTDLARANKRSNEAKIDQIIANALQDRRRLCRNGLIERVARGEFRLTRKGREYLAAQAEMLKDATALLDDLFPDLE
ncbi:winged helix-turn-helix domain-containing protein [Sphingomonas canadensis]|uniref:Winged helix-turn-helix domain-containing protein n=1 Tax=Sphingomonas canadensis TaxID=1219257 RepID=A0ABW3HCP0_9SPHN|nr:winged helix-turn-helix domain-containing protein [Sphingomonas canadensis]MCW3837073.1 winged helix-turn-helix domain-containing protein [Sphingomonas canadensis]